MTRILGVHEFESKLGVTEAELEQAIRTWALIPLPNQHISVLKGDSGTRNGKWGLLVEFESIEARNRYFDAGGWTDEFNQFLASHPQWMPAWEHLMSLAIQPWTWTDYQVR